MSTLARPLRTRLGLLALLALPSGLSAQEKPPVPPADFGKWESLSQGVLSPDGRWMAYVVNRVDEEGELRLTAALPAAAADTTIVALHGTGPSFSANSAWLAWHITVGPEERDRLQKEKKPVRDSLGLRDLSAGTVTVVPGIQTFAFSPDGRFLAMRGYAAEGKHVADVIVHDLATGTRMSFGNVSEYAWADTGAMLALTLDTEAGAGNAVELYEAATGVVRVLDSSPSRYRALAWGEKKAGDDLAVLRTVDDEAWRDTTHVVLAWTGLRSRAPTPHELDPAQVSAIPDSLRVSETYTPVWADDGSALYIGLRPRRPAPADSAKEDDDEPKSAVEVWSVNDVREIPYQRFLERSDLRRSLLTQWRLADDRVLRIGTDLQESASVLPGDRFATETDRAPYAWGWKFGRRYEDIHVVDLATGERRKALERIRYFLGPSSTGRYLAWYDSAGYWSYAVASGTRTHLSAKVPTDLTDPEWDTPADFKPMAGLAGWTKDDAAFLVFDAHDLWRLAADGSAATRLTNHAPDDIETSYVRLDREARFRADIDATKPIYLSLYGRHTKKRGFARVMPDGTVERLAYEDARFLRLMKADSADVFAFTSEDYDDSPDWFVAAGKLEAPRQASRTNPFQSDYAWGHTELVDYTSATGRALQASLVYPAQYDASKKYPMIVYTYELLSQNLHNYSVPSERNYYDPSVFSANGYFVLMPDIVFRARDPGLSVLESVVPAVHAIVARGLVDSTRVGHVGHSWGGYEAAFLPTRTHIFAASVAGAAITDMFSFAGQMHWGPGIPEWDHLETGQARMEVPYWEDRAAYERNSPEAKVNDLTTPILIEVGDADGTVDFHQGVEFFNDIRRAGKTNAVLLLYPGADHGLRKKEDQVDYHNRILQWFGHYLKGDPAPAWITEGVSWLDRKAALEGSSPGRGGAS